MKENDNFYNELTSRNGFFISNKLQQKIKNTDLLLIGCGLASNLAVDACRIGFQNFILVDGDNVEISNLNRQAFDYDDIGFNKAETLEKKLKKINKKCNIKTVNKFIEVKDIKETIKLGDVIINCADLNEVTFKICEESILQKKLSISPLNIGFGTITLAFTNKAVPLLEITKGLPKNDADYLKKLYKGMSEYSLPRYIKKKFLKAFLFIGKNGFFPQNIIATHISNAVILHTIIRYLDGKEIKLSPKPISIDIEEIYE